MRGVCVVWSNLNASFSFFFLMLPFFPQVWPLRRSFNVRLCGDCHANSFPDDRLIYFSLLLSVVCSFEIKSQQRLFTVFIDRCTIIFLKKRLHIRTVSRRTSSGRGTNDRFHVFSLLNFLSFFWSKSPLPHRKRDPLPLHNTATFSGSWFHKANGLTCPTTFSSG